MLVNNNGYMSCSAYTQLLLRALLLF